MEKLLKMSLEEKKVTSLYNDKEDTAKMYTGYIGAYNDDNILVYHISPRGLYDGYLLIDRESVFQIDYNGKYEKKIERLYDLKKQQHQNVQIKDSSILNSLLQFAQKNRNMAYVALQDSSVTGIVREFDEETIYLEVYTDYGEPDGVSTVKIDAITMAAVDTNDEQDIAILSGMS